MIIGCDLDDTIINHAPNSILLAERLGYQIDPTIPWKESIESLLPEMEIKTFKRRVYESLTLEAPIMSGCATVIQALINQGASIYVVSKRPTRLNFQKYGREWISKNLPMIPQSHIFFVTTDEEKNLVCKKHAIDIFLDDSPEVLLALESPIIPVLFDPFEIDKAIFCKRVQSWQDFYLFWQESAKNADTDVSA